MKIVISFLLFTLFSKLVYCQEPCNEDVIMRVKGKWVKRPDNNMKAANLPLINQRIDKMQQLLQQAYPELYGMEARWYRTMGGYHPAFNKNTTEYELISRFFTWYCNTQLKKLSLGTEASTSFSIWVNKFKWFADKDEKFVVDNKAVYLLTKKLGEMSGFPLYAGIDNGASNTGTNFSHTMLVSRPGQLPFTPVTRKQFLVAFLKSQEEMHNAQIEGLTKMVVRSDEEEEKFKYQQLQKVMNAETNEQVKEKARDNFLRGYTSAKQKKEADIARTVKVYHESIKGAEDYLSNTPDAELEKPAYVKDPSFALSFRAFASEKDGRMLVTINNNYYNSKLPAYVPQFFIVYWNWNSGKPSLEFADHIEKNFDFKALQGMLDK